MKRKGGQKMSYIEKAKELRAIVSPHYNCAQAVVIPFAKDVHLTEKQAYNIARNFGAGMKMGSVCGAITGGLMVLGLFEVDDSATIRAYYKHFQENHDNLMNCADLLRVSAAKGEVKKTHCDGMVYEAIRVVEEILKEKGKIS